MNYIIFIIEHYIGRRTPSPAYHRRRFAVTLRDQEVTDQDRVYSANYNSFGQPQPDSTINDIELSSAEYNHPRYRYTTDGKKNVPFMYLFQSYIARHDSLPEKH